jgi:hypothetical protein
MRLNSLQGYLTFLIGIGMILSIALSTDAAFADVITKTLDETEQGAAMSNIPGLVSGILIMTELDKTISDVVVFEAANGNIPSSANLRSDDVDGNDAPNVDITQAGLQALINSFPANQRVTMLENDVLTNGYVPTQANQPGFFTVGANDTRKWVIKSDPDELPEPSTLVLVGFSLGLLLVYRRRQQKQPHR